MLSGCTYVKALMLGGLAGLAPHEYIAELKRERGRAKDFSATRFDGSTLSLADFSGEPVVLNFWADW
jgi:hypothetical protein